MKDHFPTVRDAIKWTQLELNCWILIGGTLTSGTFKQAVEDPLLAELPWLKLLLIMKMVLKPFSKSWNSNLLRTIKSKSCSVNKILKIGRESFKELLLIRRARHFKNQLLICRCRYSVLSLNSRKMVANQNRKMIRSNSRILVQLKKHKLW